MLLYQKRGLQSEIVASFPNTTWQNSAPPPPDHELFTKRILGYSDSRFLCSHVAENEAVMTPRKIPLLKYVSNRTVNQMRAKMSLFQGHLFLVWWKNANY